MNDTSLMPSALLHDTFWAIEPTAGQLLAKQLASTDRKAHESHYRATVSQRSTISARARGDDRPYDLQQSVAILSLVGPMTKAQVSFGSGCSTVQLRRDLRAANADPDVKAIILRIDSPGGSVAGTAELADEVAAINKVKPVYAYIEDCGCSAAYWVASQAKKIFANRTAIVGSIGTLLVLEDWSKAFEQAGVEVLVFSTGEFKGSGTFGTEITLAQREKFQKMVDGLQEHFLSAVSTGRRISKTKAKALADGNTHVGMEALDLGLVDEIASFDQVLRSIAGKPSGAKAEDDLPTGGPLSGLRLEEELEAALSAVEGVTSRLEGYSTWRIEHGRSPIGEARLEQVEAINARLSSLIEACQPQPLPQVQEFDESELLARSLALRTAHLGTP